MIVLIVFNVVALTIVGLIHFYLWKRLVRDAMRSGRTRRLGTVLIVLLALLIPAGRAWHVEWLTWAGYVWLAAMFYLLVALGVLEVPRLVIGLAGLARRKGRRRAPVPAVAAPAGSATQAGTPATIASASSERPRVGRRLLLARTAAIAAGVTAAGVTGYGIRAAAGPPRLTRVRIPLAKLPRSLDGMRLAVVSDIHIGPLRASHHVDRIVRVINSVNADVVCIVGDLVDGTVPELGKYARPLADIESRRGAYFVTGNHEYYSGFEPWIDEIAELGVRPLRNARTELDGLDLAGVNDLGGADYGDPTDFAKALGDRDTSRPVVLMAHQPVAARDAAKYGVDLQVSGHTHGGQAVPFNLLVRLQQPVVSGLGHVDGVPVYVTDGAGFWGPPVRVGVPPEVSVIELRSA